IHPIPALCLAVQLSRRRLERVGMRNEAVDPDRAAHCGELTDAHLELSGDTNKFKREHRRRAKLPKVASVDADVIGHPLPIDLVEGRLERMMPPATGGVGTGLQLFGREPTLRPEGRHPKAEKRGVANLRRPMPFPDAVSAQHARLDSLVKSAQLER